MHTDTIREAINWNSYIIILLYLKNNNSIATSFLNQDDLFQSHLQKALYLPVSPQPNGLIGLK